MLGAITKPLGGGLAGNVLSLYAVQGLGYVLPVLMLPFLLRGLGPESYGSIVFAQSVVGYAAILVEFGFNFTAARDISIARDQPLEVAKIFWTTMAAKLFLLVIGTLLLCPLIAFTRFRTDWPIFTASGLLLVGNVVFPQWYFQGLERLKEVAAFQVIAKCVVAGAVILCVRSPRDAWIAALILSAPQVLGVVAAACLGKLPWPVNFYLPSVLDIKQALARSWHLFAASASTTLYLHTNTVVLGFMCGERAVALYGVGNRIISAVQGLSLPVTQSIFPRASQLFATHRQRAFEFVRLVSWILLPAFAVLGLVIAIFAPAIVNVVAGVEFQGAVNLLRIMAALPLLVTLAVILSQIVMVNAGLQRHLPRIYLAVGLLNLALLPLLIKSFAENGAAVSLLIAETLGPLLMLRAILRNSGPDLQRSAPDLSGRA